MNYHENPRDVIATLKKQTLCKDCRVIQLALHPSSGMVNFRTPIRPFMRTFTWSTVAS